MFKQRGFTLVEILVALFIFAIIGVVAAASLQSMIRTHHALQIADKKLLELQIFMTLIRRDMAQAIDRPIRDSDGNSEPSFVGSGGSQITLTRTGLINPFNSAAQSDMQRVGYDVEGGDLVRLTWNVLDQPPKAVPEKQVLLHHVTSLKWQFIGDNGAPSNSWPPTVGTNMQKESSDLPKAVLMLITVGDEGVIQGVFPVPARGLREKIQS